MPAMISVSRKEFNALKSRVKELNERLDILMDKDLMGQVRESEAAIKKGEVRSFDEVRKELGI
jgi:tetrahydromethanopterin S-methyltransferase subunit G